MHAVIIGAGIGGLCLAQGLRRRGISVAVYERNETTADALAGYGIHLDPNGWNALAACLPADRLACLDRVASHAGAELHFRTEGLKLLATRDEAWLSGHPERDVERRGVGRIALRELLLEGIEDAVHWGCEYERYEKDGNHVMAHFRGGGIATGDVLVGADASHSRVRRQRLPSLDRTDLGILNIAGRFPLDEEAVASLPACLTDGSLNNIVPSTGWMFASAWRLGDRNATASGSDRSDYVVWAFAAARESYPAEIDEMDGEALRRTVLDRMEGWSPALRRIVAECDAATVGRIPLKCMPALPEWIPDNVTLLGDAIHNMTPMAGIGANTALRDAALLAEELGKAAEGHQTPVGAIAAYEPRMRVYADEAVGRSRDNARRAAFSSPFARFSLRSVLGLAGAVPLVRRALFS